MTEGELVEELALPNYHCESCHEDRDVYGTDMMEVEYRGRVVVVCCDVARAFDEL